MAKPEVLSVYLKKAEQIVRRAVNIIKDEKRKGGFICIADLTGFPLLISQIDEVDQEKTRKYQSLCQEKALRLNYRSEHISSWQSRDYVNSRFGGSIRAGQYILSFSGFPEHWDEACMVALAIELGFPLTEEQVAEIEKISENPFIRKLLK